MEVWNVPYSHATRLDFGFKLVRFRGIKQKLSRLQFTVLGALAGCGIKQGRPCLDGPEKKL